MDDLVAKCKNSSSAVFAKVDAVVTKNRHQGRPVPMNTVAMLKACRNVLGIGRSADLIIVAGLYLIIFLLYVRTVSTK